MQNTNYEPLVPVELNIARRERDEAREQLAALRAALKQMAERYYEDPDGDAPCHFVAWEIQELIGVEGGAK